MVLIGGKFEVLRFVVVINGDEFVLICIVVGDGVSMNVGYNIKEVLNILIFLYYVLDLIYFK